jgi:endonuclease YncB( thermonuclease family)
MIKEELWRYPCVLGPVHDGDTVEQCEVDMGLHLSLRMRDPKDKNIAIRLANVNAPELKTGAPGQQARAFSDAWVTQHDHEGGRRFYLRFYHVWQDDFGRFLARVECSEGHCLNDDLVASGNAVPYLVQTE